MCFRAILWLAVPILALGMIGAGIYKYKGSGGIEKGEPTLLSTLTDIRDDSTSRFKKIKSFLKSFAQDSSAASERGHHFLQQLLHGRAEGRTDEFWDSLEKIIHLPRFNKSKGCKLQKEVFGFHPYWMGSAYKSYDYNLLTTLSYFSATVNPATGDFSTTSNWETAAVIDSAQKYGVKVELTICNFGGTNNSTLLSSAQARTSLIQNTITLVKQRNANGVTVDFEMVSSSSKNDFNSFMQELSASVKQDIPNGTVSLCLYSVDWNKVFDIPFLNQYVDRYVLMAYDYYGSSSTQAGPVGLLSSGNYWFPYNVEKSVSFYLNEGVEPRKLILCLPYYGLSWPVAEDAILADKTANPSCITFANWLAMKPNTNFETSWDSVSANYFGYPSTNVQVWMNDVKGVAQNFDLVNDEHLGGAGIWALGYDNGSHLLWDLIKETFSHCRDQSARK